MKLVEFLRARAFEDPFIMHGEKWQFVTVLRADGAEDIGVYRFATDLCYDYADFRAHFNLARTNQIQSMKTIDDRNEEQKRTHTWAIVAKDRSMSHWGGASGGVSRCAWAVPLSDLDKVKRWVRARGDMSYVRPIILANYRAPKGTAHLHIYVVDANHPAVNS